MTRPLLYKLTASPPACSVMMLADLLGVNLEFKEPDWRKMEHKSPEYLKMNPMGTIPTLKDGDVIVSESHAIMKYLLAKYGGEYREELYPSGLRTRTRVDERMFFNAGVFFVRLKVVALPTLLHGLDGPTAQHLADIETAYGAVEAYLESHAFIAADHLTLADLAVGSTAAFMQPILQLDEEKFPRMAVWLSKLEAQPFFNKFSGPGVALLDKSLNMFWKLNKNKSTTNNSTGKELPYSAKSLNF